MKEIKYWTTLAVAKKINQYTMDYQRTSGLTGSLACG